LELGFGGADGFFVYGEAILLDETSSFALGGQKSDAREDFQEGFM
jgi:hypothetical protein